MAYETIETTCCIVGGGPAGVMLGYLLARRGVAVTVLEKHRDFFRDFRGDTVHPSTLEVIHELGLLPPFLKVSHQELSQLRGRVGNFEFRAADFSCLPTHCKFIALMPQWDFLDFLTENARRFPSFNLRMEHEATDLLREGDCVSGVEARTPQGTCRVHADLVVACDGRHSTIRKAARLEVVDTGVPIDVLWFRLSHRPGDPAQSLGNVNYGKVLILINRGDYYQAGLLIRKGTFDEVMRGGLDAFRASILQIAPWLNDRVEEIKDWEQVKLLSVQLNRLRHWYCPGLLCIGDAAHAMSPVGGVGINLAIQDAVAAANLLTDSLLQRRTSPALLARVQDRREFPTRVTQRAQARVHRLLQRIFDNPGPAEAPWQLKLLASFPATPHITGRAVGMGVRPEHIADSARTAASRPRLFKVAICVGVASGVAALAMSAIRTYARRRA